MERTGKRLPKGIKRYQYIFCAWLWVWSVVFLLGLVNTSPAISLIIAATFSNILLWGTNLYRGTHWSKYMAITIGEIFLALLFALYLGGDKWSPRALMINALYFALYILYVRIRGFKFSGIYFKKLPRLHRENPSQNVMAYVKSIF